MGFILCPYCATALALLPTPPGIVRHNCPSTKTWQSGCIRPLEEGGTWFLSIRDQVHLSAEVTRGTGAVRILTGRWNDDGTKEVLIEARGRDDLHATERMDSYCKHVMKDRA